MLLHDTMTATDARYSRYRMPAFVLAAVLLVGVALSMILAIRGFSRSNDWIEHSYQVMAAAESVRSSARSLESNARGYRLSGRASMLAEYLAAAPQSEAAIAQLVALTRDNPTQNDRARRLQALLDQRLHELERLLDVQAKSGMEAAQQATAKGPGVEQMRRLNALTDDILGAERRLLQQRRVEAARQYQLLTAGVVAGILLPMVLLGALLWGLARENRRVRFLRQEAHDAMDRLQESLEVRDHLSEQRRVLGAYAGLLQSCQDRAEAMAITARVIEQMLPAAGGRCYVLRASQNLAETADTFGRETVPGEPLIHPEACWALRRGQTHRSDGGVGAVHCAHIHAEGMAESAWCLCVPLMAQGTSLGLLHVNGPTGGQAEDVALIEAIAEQLSLALVNLQLRESLRVQSLRDPLTGLYNRRYLEENLQREMLRCQRRHQPLAVVMLDVDHFKQFNDQHGHAAGDALLARVGQALQGLTRNEDMACRYGGEEFTVVMPETDRATALRRAEEMRDAIASTTVLHMRKMLGPNTASLGVAIYPEDAHTVEDLVAMADAALYRAKHAGRNRVVMHDSTA